MSKQTKAMIHYLTKKEKEIMLLWYVRIREVDYKSGTDNAGGSFVLASMSFGIFKVKEMYRKDLCSTVVRADTFCWSATVLISSMLFITGTLESLLPGLWWLDCVGSIG
eukprot:23758_2